LKLDNPLPLVSLSEVEKRTWVHVERVEIATGEVVRIEGWVFVEGGAPIERVRVVTPEGTHLAVFPIPRPDVAAAFPSARQAEASGFAIQLKNPPRSRFKLQLESASPDDDWSAFFRTAVAASGETETNFRNPRPPGSPPAAEVPHPGFYLWFDEPFDWTKIARRFRLSGWCFCRDNTPIEAIRVRIGAREFPGSYGVFRADVAQMHRENAATFKSGFEIMAEAPRGRATLVVEVRRADGAWTEIFSKKIRAPLINLRPISDAQLWEIGDYATWIKRYDTLRSADRGEIRADIERFSATPLISIVMPVYNPSPAHLRAAIESVRAQLYPRWELCVVNDASPAQHVDRILARYAKCDPRIKVQRRAENGGIAAASNDALALTTGDFVALLDDDDVFAPVALYFVAREINSHPDAQLIYSDEDKLDTTGRRGNAHFKPDWNWPLFLAQNFFSHLGVFRSELIKSVGFRAGFEGSQDYDLVLRCAEQVEPRQIRHIPRLLYHWRMSEKSAALNISAKPHARAAAIRAVEEHLARRKIAGDVTSSGDEDFRRIRYHLPNEKPRVSIIIPTRDVVALLRACVESLLEKTTYPNFEIVLVDNGSQDPAALSFLAAIQRDPRVRLLRWEEEFNFGRLNNFAVRKVESEFVALLNNDLTIINPDWLGEMVSQALQPGVGAVGARLLYPDDHIQHAGVILGGGGVAAHAHKGLPRANHGYFSRAILVQELSAVTAACMLVRRSAYLAVGGFDETHLKIAFNDVDFCLRLREHGYRIIYTPYAELYHAESASRGLEDTVAKNNRFEAEIKYMHDTWGDALLQDPAYNPNLSLVSGGFTLAFPPRVSFPWRTK
jgi:GT2 family glycosyltransferase